MGSTALSSLASTQLDSLNSIALSTLAGTQLDGLLSTALAALASTQLDGLSSTVLSTLAGVNHYRAAAEEFPVPEGDHQSQQGIHHPQEQGDNDNHAEYRPSN
ncbi:trimeric autotransporter adhesin [uncultured Gammaproteobacteria bacterium]